VVRQVIGHEVVMVRVIVGGGSGRGGLAATSFSMAAPVHGGLWLVREWKEETKIEEREHVGGPCNNVVQRVVGHEVVEVHLIVGGGGGHGGLAQKHPLPWLRQCVVASGCYKSGKAVAVSKEEGRRRPAGWCGRQGRGATG
jgi:hypothetical protein